MRILLPPSEGKTPPGQGEPLALAALLFPALEEPRRAVLSALTMLCTQKPATALTTLGLTPHQTEVLHRNQNLLIAPTAPAWQIYTGVLYSHLDAATLTAAQQTKLSDSLWIVSALFGFVRFTDPLPAYRLSGDATLPGIGTLASFWRSHLTPLLASESKPILDLRSGIYTKLAPLPASVTERSLTVRVLQKMPAGPPKLITHFNKATKGRIVRAIAQHQESLNSTDDLVQLIATSLNADTQLIAPTKTSPSTQLEICLPVSF